MIELDTVMKNGKEYLGKNRIEIRRALAPEKEAKKYSSTSIKKTVNELKVFKSQHGDMSIRSTKPISIKVESLTARSTSYSKEERWADADTKAGKTALSGFELSLATSKKIGTVAVDPKIIPYGSLVIAKNGKAYLAVDTGSHVKSKKASHEYALERLKKGYINEAEYSQLSKLPVLDFFTYGKKPEQVCGHYDDFVVVKGMSIPKKLSERSQMMTVGFWKNVLENANSESINHMVNTLKDNDNGDKKTITNILLAQNNHSPSYLE